MDYKIIGFDADDTLWVNEPYYRKTESKFYELMHEYGNKEYLLKKLLSVELQNIELYGFGTKAFMLSLIETALKVSQKKINPDLIEEIISLGKSQIARRNEVFPEVEVVLKKLSEKYRLIVATKGDLLDQERKLKNSRLLAYFHHIEVMSDKKEENYKRLLHHLDIKPKEFLMVGNSMKSDILPVLNLGANAIYIPFHTTWVYEEVPDADLTSSRFIEIEKFSELLKIL